MNRVAEEPDREQRIDLEIIVDAYVPEEQAMGWYYYLDKKLHFPFPALWNGSEVEVVEMSPEDDCEQQMFVEVLYQEGEAEDIFSVPLSDIEVEEVDDETAEAIADWHYWLNRGYDFT
ncbi:calcium-binding protein [Merismopedia glauca]|uniref:Calcium-binding protein n=1 Tax=Merismopedia glauca CCAP 1448/3 TaxID=1296344 RepID=A0A2T1BWK2_9CYAN|nr:calcium-binding protein [Merismopedia glauca]PSB00399.1 calcium-binding protein [Merismopedia glauca CCAP 1448/3]